MGWPTTEINFVLSILFLFYVKINVIFLITKHFVIMKLGFELEISPLPECPVFINSEHSTN